MVFLSNVIWSSFYGISNTAWTPISLCLILLKYTRLACIYFWYLSSRWSCGTLVQLCPISCTAAVTHCIHHILQFQKLHWDTGWQEHESNSVLALLVAQQALFCGKSSFWSNVLALEALEGASEGGVLLVLVRGFFQQRQTSLEMSSAETASPPSKAQGSCSCGGDWENPSDLLRKCHMCKGKAKSEGKHYFYFKNNWASAWHLGLS